MYLQQSTKTNYVRRQDLMEHMSDMLDCAMCYVNVICRREISACVLNDAKNVSSRTKCEKHFDDILRIKFSPANIK